MDNIDVPRIARRAKILSGFLMIFPPAYKHI
jgi:hypothetical protein